MKINKSFYFQNNQNQQYFLFQLINTGDDNLKFIFSQKGSGTGSVYQSKGIQPTIDDVVSLYSEFTYHKDGLILIKPERQKQINPYGKGIKRKSISQIREFEPILKYTVTDYNICRKSNPSNLLMIPQNEKIFNGRPFECIIYLGYLDFADPPNNKDNEMIYRTNDIAQNIDMILWIYKSNDIGRIITIPNTQIQIFNTSNIIQVVGTSRI